MTYLSFIFYMKGEKMPKKYILEGIQLEIDDEFLNKVKENKQVKSINKNHK